MGTVSMVWLLTCSCLRLGVVPGASVTVSSEASCPNYENAVGAMFLARPVAAMEEMISTNREAPGTPDTEVLDDLHVPP